MHRQYSFVAVLLTSAILTGCGSAATPPARSAGHAASHAAPHAAPHAAASATAKGTSGVQGAGPVSSHTSALRKITLQWPFVPSSDAGPFLWAEKQGYYRKVGLDVKIQWGTGAANDIQQVASGHAQFGYGSLDIAALARAKGVPVIAVAAILRRNIFGIFVDAKSNIRSFRGLVGHRLLISAGEPATYYLPEVAKLDGFNVNGIKMVYVAANAKVGLYLKGDGNAMSTSIPFADPFVQAKRPSRVLYFANSGITAYAEGIFVRPDYLKAHPNVVRNFLAASFKAWETMVKNPKVADAAEAWMAKLHPTLNAHMLQASWSEYPKFVYSPRTKGHPFGWESAGDWRSTLQMLHSYAGLRGSLSPSHYYTNAYLPK